MIELIESIKDLRMESIDISPPFFKMRLKRQESQLASDEIRNFHNKTLGKNEKIIQLNCMGRTEGVRWLKGEAKDVSSGVVSLTQESKDPNSFWKVVELGEGMYAFQNLAINQGAK